MTTIKLCLPLYKESTCARYIQQSRQVRFITVYLWTLVIIWD